MSESETAAPISCAEENIEQALKSERLQNQQLRERIENLKAQISCLKQQIGAVFTTAAIFEYNGGNK